MSESISCLQTKVDALVVVLAIISMPMGCRSAEPVASDIDALRADSAAIHVRINLVGYLPDDNKVAIAFSHRPVDAVFRVRDATDDAIVFQDTLKPSDASGWGRFAYYYEADFSSVREDGRYYVQIEQTVSPASEVSNDAYAGLAEHLLGFMRQQRCGYNPFLDLVCHQNDGMSFYGPMADSTFVDVRGGWHDAGDQLKYLITGSNATAGMMLAHELAGERFADKTNDLGQAAPNGVSDLLDEARWGLEWMLKLHPGPGLLIHQVADDRDHYGWKMPNADNSDYGWGANSYRPAYFATGSPQGLREYKSEATGIANLTGRYAAAMAMGHRAWTDLDSTYADRLLVAAQEVYRMGAMQEGYQQGNSYGAPYRYAERTWADDMEWGATELFKVTGDTAYLEDAIRYARIAGSTSWMQRDTTEHYEFYPFVNVGHFALYPSVDAAFQDTLAGFYREGIERTAERAGQNPFGIGVPFIWCSNNLVSALITQIMLYERMTGDLTYHDHMLRQRDWLFGRNPWGTSMFTGIPADGEHPDDVHTSVWALTGQEVPGGLVDGPVLASIYSRLKGIHLLEPDEFEAVQNSYVVYHDDIGDYATNEPTMDGTAGAVFWIGTLASDGR